MKYRVKKIVKTKFIHMIHSFFYRYNLHNLHRDLFSHYPGQVSSRLILTLSRVGFIQAYSLITQGRFRLDLSSHYPGQVSSRLILSLSRVGCHLYLPLHDPLFFFSWSSFKLSFLSIPYLLPVFYSFFILNNSYSNPLLYFTYPT